MERTKGPVDSTVRAPSIGIMSSASDVGRKGIMRVSVQGANATIISSASAGEGAGARCHHTRL
ncbi:hypothetical protein Scep_010206 [Stephania cephalantha]|uniref:Uncharacterized protein n=1 Tax=Stephania cephalantha TaxID=152367 RepID=A0AAP0JVM2_9MAGN